MSVTGYRYTSTRSRGLADWSPQGPTLNVIEQVKAVLDEYQEYLPLTARQVFYRLVGAHGYDKTEKAYKRLGEYLNRARRAELIPWNAIRDDGFDQTGGGGWKSPQHFIHAIRAQARNYKRDHQDGQPVYTEIWVEAAGMMPQVRQMVADYSIPIFSSGGFNSTTAKYQSALRIGERMQLDDRRTRILHIGDYDPSGVAIIDSLADDIDTFLHDMWVVELTEWVRVAVTPDQIDRYQLPGTPAKTTDQRAGFSDLATQAEALSPPQLEAEILAAVREEWDDGIFTRLLETEKSERDALVAALKGLAR